MLGSCRSLWTFILADAVDCCIASVACMKLILLVQFRPKMANVSWKPVPAEQVPYRAARKAKSGGYGPQIGVA
jgi:hypothetical protein